MNEDFLECHVLRVETLSPSVRMFRISYPLSDHFIPGQFVMLDMPIQHEFTTRSYSIASAPNKEGWIELCVVHKPGGEGSTYLFENSEPGTALKVSPPLGKFILDEGNSPLCFICTGTGIAPFRSMIRHLMAENGKLPRPVTLVFGNRKPGDILYHSEWEALARELSGFTFIPVLSQADEWTGAKGYVHPYYLEVAEKAPETCFYICGWKEMVKEAKNNLKDRGFSRKQLKFELYD